jgi:hypothetical protein
VSVSEKLAGAKMSNLPTLVLVAMLSMVTSGSTAADASFTAAGTGYATAKPDLVFVAIKRIAMEPTEVAP